MNSDLLHVSFLTTLMSKPTLLSCWQFLRLCFTSYFHSTIVQRGVLYWQLYKSWPRLLKSSTVNQPVCHVTSCCFTADIYIKLITLNVNIIRCWTFSWSETKTDLFGGRSQRSFRNISSLQRNNIICENRTSEHTIRVTVFTSFSEVRVLENTPVHVKVLHLKFKLACFLK